jgi:hypothetical protein
VQQYISGYIIHNSKVFKGVARTDTGRGLKATFIFSQHKECRLRVLPFYPRLEAMMRMLFELEQLGDYLRL